MTVSAGDKSAVKEAGKAFSSIKVGKKKVKFKKGKSWPKVSVKEEKTHVTIKLKKGWSLKSISYYKGDTGKTRNLVVRRQIGLRLSKNSKSYLTVKASNGKKTVKAKVYAYQK
jgi:hypothetical protein